jgi:hypothetical protein
MLLATLFGDCVNCFEFVVEGVVVLGWTIGECVSRVWKVRWGYVIAEQKGIIEVGGDIRHESGRCRILRSPIPDQPELVLRSRVWDAHLNSGFHKDHVLSRFTDYHSAVAAGH